MVTAGPLAPADPAPTVTVTRQAAIERSAIYQQNGTRAAVGSSCCGSGGPDEAGCICAARCIVTEKPGSASLDTLQTSEIGVTLNIAAGRWVRFTPESRHRLSALGCPLYAKRGHAVDDGRALGRAASLLRLRALWPTQREITLGAEDIAVKACNPLSPP